VSESEIAVESVQGGARCLWGWDLRKGRVLRLEWKNDDEMRDTESKNSVEYKNDKIQKMTTVKTTKIKKW